MASGVTPGDENQLRTFLARIRSGDEEAARELLVRYEPQVRLVVRRQLPRLLRSRFDSIDFLQSVWGDFFMRMRREPEEFDDPQDLVAFLAQAAKNKVIDEYRRALSQKHDMRLEKPISGSHQLKADVDSPSEVAEAHEAFGRLRELLPESRRNILELKAEGLSSREIGARIGCSERTVRRVLEELRHRADGQKED